MSLKESGHEDEKNRQIWLFSFHYQPPTYAYVYAVLQIQIKKQTFISTSPINVLHNVCINPLLPIHIGPLIYYTWQNKNTELRNVGVIYVSSSWITKCTIKTFIRYKLESHHLILDLICISKLAILLQLASLATVQNTWNAFSCSYSKNYSRSSPK